MDFLILYSSPSFHPKKDFWKFQTVSVVSVNEQEWKKGWEETDFIPTASSLKPTPQSPNLPLSDEEDGKVWDCQEAGKRMVWASSVRLSWVTPKSDSPENWQWIMPTVSWIVSQLNWLLVILSNFYPVLFPLKVTSHLQRPKKSFFFLLGQSFYLAFTKGKC